MEASRQQRKWKASFGGMRFGSSVLLLFFCLTVAFQACFFRPSSVLQSLDASAHPAIQDSLPYSIAPVTYCPRQEGSLLRSVSFAAIAAYPLSTQNLFSLSRNESAQDSPVALLLLDSGLEVRAPPIFSA